MILAIDPGNEQSAYVFMDKSLRPVEFGIQDNETVLRRIQKFSVPQGADCVVEMVASYGMPVGVTVFETVYWIGKFCGAAESRRFNRVERIYRMEEKMHICHNSRAKDSNIRQALIDRFGPVGTKKEPGWFYGFKKDIWAAYAVGLTYAETKMEV